MKIIRRSSGKAVKGSSVRSRMAKSSLVRTLSAQGKPEVSRSKQRKAAASGNAKPQSRKRNRRMVGARATTTRAVFSTGILRRNPDTTYALVDLVNLGTTIANRMTVQVFDWSSGLPVALNLSPCNTTKCLVSLAPGTSNFVFADVSGVEFKYEVRISRAAFNRNVILNVSGLSAEPMTPQVGNNVLQLQLFRIKRRSCNCQ
ncbi:hypothetical protein [Paenibacillus rhizovicinus]|nr:hypothetical protein [Paenibacillus rhizovicinus]